MKHLFSGVWRPRRQILALSKKNNPSLLFSAILLIVFLTTGCKKESKEATPQEEVQGQSSQSFNAGSNGFGNYSGLAPETVAQLQQAKIATAKYNDFDNAINDGYVDINVIVPEMGHHYLKMANLDANFEADKPEILVYNKEENGRMKLLAVEYAVPISLSPNAPQGFAGTDDHWAVYQGTLWTLHAWVWEFNPSGVFNPTNPLVHVD